MRLLDRVELLRRQTDGSYTSRGTVPANVSYTDSGSKVNEERTVNEAGQTVATATSTAYTTEIRVILEPGVDVDESLDRLRWDGDVYRIEGKPLKRRKSGRTHHQTVNVVLVG